MLFSIITVDRSVRVMINISFVATGKTVAKLEWLHYVKYPCGRYWSHYIDTIFTFSAANLSVTRTEEPRAFGGDSLFGIGACIDMEGTHVAPKPHNLR